MKKIAKYFFNGLMFLLPVVATVYIISVIFVKIDTLFHFPVPGAGFALTIMIIIGIGFIGSNFVTRKLVHVVDMLFSRLPLIKIIYTSFRDLIHAFVGDRKGFTKPVAVTVSQESSIRLIGFVTKESLDDLGMPGSVAVYLPQSYNFAGNLIIVPAAQVTPLKSDSTAVMKFVVSGGIATS